MEGGVIGESEVTHDFIDDTLVGVEVECEAGVAFTSKRD